MNNVLCEIEQDKKWAVSYFYYKENRGWHKNIHKKGGSAHDNILDTLNSISETSVMYVLRVDNDPAGFFVRYASDKGICLEGFHVIEKYRTSDFLSVFWKELKFVLGDEFVTGIYEKNKRAIDHLVKQGFTFDGKVEEQNKTFYILKLKQ
jgi:hypothetical protein